MELPGFVIKILQGMGVEGAIIAVLLSALGGAITTIGLLLRHAAKVYKYRLEERDRLLEALNKSSDVLADILKVTEERNELTEEQSELIKMHSVAFEILKVTIVGQFETIKQNHTIAMENFRASATAVASIADAVRTLNEMILDNRMSVSEHINGIRQLVQDTRESLHNTINNRHDVALSEFRSKFAQISTGGDTIVIERKRRVHDTRPTKKS